MGTDYGRCNPMIVRAVPTWPLSRWPDLACANTRRYPGTGNGIPNDHPPATFGKWTMTDICMCPRATMVAMAKSRGHASATVVTTWRTPPTLGSAPQDRWLCRPLATSKPRSPSGCDQHPASRTVGCRIPVPPAMKWRLNMVMARETKWSAVKIQGTNHEGNRRKSSASPAFLARLKPNTNSFCCRRVEPYNEYPDNWRCRRLVRTKSGAERWIRSRLNQRADVNGNAVWRAN